jgi:hypothetical protein
MTLNQQMKEPHGMEYSSDYTVQEIFGSILLQKWKYVYVVEFVMQNIKLAFKLWNWLWFKQILFIFLTRSRTQQCHELNLQMLN